MNISTFNAFRSRNYRLYFFGQFISLTGTWIQRTAVYWIMYEMTNSAFMLGITVFASQFPAFLFSLIGGAVADKYNKYKVLILTQIASMFQAILLTVVVVFTDYSITEILVLSVILGIINAFDIPARQSMLHHMIDDKSDLPNAIALNSSMFNLARLFGPAISGIILAQYGAGICFTLNSLSFFAVITTLLMMKFPDYLPQTNTKKIIDGLKEGWSYIFSTPVIGILILLLSLSSFFVLPYITLLPIMAKETLGGDAATYGYLNSFIGIGAFFGAITLASFKSAINLRKVLVIATIILGTGIVLFSYTNSLMVAYSTAVISGFGMIMHIAIINTLLQTISSVEMRGRVISYFAMALFGMQPIGALLVGTISHYIGASVTIAIEGLFAILIALMFSKYLWHAK